MKGMAAALYRLRGGADNRRHGTPTLTSFAAPQRGVCALRAAGRTLMNPLLARLHPYPFERWRELTRGVTPNPALRPISLGIGEPKHATPALIEEAIVQGLKGFSAYPATAGEPALREAMAGWLRRRYGIAIDAATQVLPVNGSREALFAFAQTVIDPTRPGATVVCPNPFYQIYEGAALLAGAQTAFAPSDPKRNFAPDWSAIDDATWARTQLVYVCSPGNPTGAVMPMSEWEQLFALSDRHGFVIASDECYSEIYFRDDPPLGGLEAAHRLGRGDYRRLVAFTSLSKRSNVPGMRSGFVAGDAALMKAFLLYRTYHGSAMSPVVQKASRAAWNDEAHVVANRELYRRKFGAVTPLLAGVLDVRLPDAGFYLWAGIPGGDDVAWSLGLLAQYNVTVLPGSLLAREANGFNPGAGRVRMALVAEVDECLEAARRIVAYSESLRP
jgi:N-succinyldiaminopimelate aminotransferase